MRGEPAIAHRVPGRQLVEDGNVLGGVEAHGELRVDRREPADEVVDEAPHGALGDLGHDMVVFVMGTEGHRRRMDERVDPDLEVGRSVRGHHHGRTRGSAGRARVGLATPQPVGHVTTGLGLHPRQAVIGMAEVAEEVVEGTVLLHQHHDVVDLGQPGAGGVVEHPRSHILGAGEAHMRGLGHGPAVVGRVVQHDEPVGLGGEVLELVASLGQRHEALGEVTTDHALEGRPAGEVVDRVLDLLAGGVAQGDPDQPERFGEYAGVHLDGDDGAQLVPAIHLDGAEREIDGHGQLERIHVHRYRQAGQIQNLGRLPCQRMDVAEQHAERHESVRFLALRLDDGVRRDDRTAVVGVGTDPEGVEVHVDDLHRQIAELDRERTTERFGGERRELLGHADDSPLAVEPHRQRHRFDQPPEGVVDHVQRDIRALAHLDEPNGGCRPDVAVTDVRELATPGLTGQARRHLVAEHGFGGLVASPAAGSGLAH